MGDEFDCTLAGIPVEVGARTGEQRVRIIPAKNLDNVSDDQINAIRKLQKKGENLLRRAEAEERKIIRLKQAGAAEEPGPLTADVYCEKKGKRLVPHIRKRRPGEGTETGE